MRRFVYSLLLVIASCLVSTAYGARVLGDITIPRVGGNDSAAFMPQAVFPHWKHRLHYTCYACHETLFQMKAGADHITMDDISAGQFCAVCHNGKTAFQVGFQTCERCHFAPTSGH